MSVFLEIVSYHCVTNNPSDYRTSRFSFSYMLAGCRAVAPLYTSSPPWDAWGGSFMSMSWQKEKNPGSGRKHASVLSHMLSHESKSPGQAKHPQGMCSHLTGRQAPGNTVLTRCLIGANPLRGEERMPSLHRKAKWIVQLPLTHVNESVSNFKHRSDICCVHYTFKMTSKML